MILFISFNLVLTDSKPSSTNPPDQKKFKKYHFQHYTHYILGWPIFVWVFHKVL